MTLSVPSPVECRIDGIDRSTLEQHLRYIDRKVDFEISRLKRSAAYINTGDSEALAGYRERLKELQDARKKSLLYEDTRGLYTYSGLAPWLGEKFGIRPDVLVEYPEPVGLGWNHEPTHPDREYQIAAADALLAVKHGAVEMGTGLGKSRILERIVQTLGLKSVVMAPSLSIAHQLLAMFRAHFSARYVGQFFGGKKDVNRLITVAVAKSLTLVNEGSEAWDDLSRAQVFIVDESHLVAAETLKTICLGLMRGAPYRFFFSATQMRTDGLDLLLKGITGPIVHRMTVKEGVDGGWLAKPAFRMVPVQSDVQYRSGDIARMTRKHLYFNPQVLKLAGLIANRSVQSLRRQTLILVDEVEQFSRLLPYLRHPVEFAHGPLDKSNREAVAERYRKSDPHGLVQRFNDGEFPILVGTSSVSIGTDVQSVGSLIYLMGGMSEIQVRQAVGRGTRGGCNSTVTQPLRGDWWPWADKKLDCLVWDFKISLPEDKGGGSMSALLRHSLERRSVYEDIYGPVVDVAM